jgi:hypothetical protein
MKAIALSMTAQQVGCSLMQMAQAFLRQSKWFSFQVALRQLKADF